MYKVSNQKKRLTKADVLLPDFKELDGMSADRRNLFGIYGLNDRSGGRHVYALI